MNAELWSLVFGVLVTVACLLFVISRRQTDKEFVDKVTKTKQVSIQKSNRSFSYMQILRADAATIGEAEKADLWLRMAVVGAVILISFAVLLRAPIIVFLAPVMFAAPLLYAKARRKAYLRRLNEQTRLAQMVMAFLLRAGATLTDTLGILENKLGAPISNKLREVNTRKRYATLPGALEDLADSTGVVQLREFATLISESERYGTPVADALMRHIKLDMKLRDAAAAERYGNVQMEMTFYALILIAMPGFSFVLYAMLSFALHMFGAFSFT
jgi:Flp pilus assembly protein TadB